MTYTTKQLQAMSDFELNKAIALKIYPNATVVRSMPDDESVTIITGEFNKIMVDYCNNPNDIMPLAFERKIGGHYGKATPDLYFAVSRDEKHISVHTNPLRAIACLILMMED